MNNVLKIALILSAGILYSCKEEAGETPFMEIVSGDVALLSQPFPKEAGNRTVAISTNQDVVKATASENWCSAEILENGGFSLRISVYPNTGFSERTTEVTVYSKGLPEIKIPVTQWGDAPVLTIEESEILIEDGNLDFSLHVATNIDITFTLPAWIQNKGDNTPVAGAKIYNFTASVMTPGSRDGEILVTAEGYEALNKTIPIRQTQSRLHPTLTAFAPASGEKESTVTLSGNNFGTVAQQVKVYFNQKPATVNSVTNETISVTVPKAPGENCDISVVIGEDSIVYANKFTYVKSWSLTTLTGNGTAAFKPGTLSEAQIKARYLSIDDNENIYASSREDAANRFVVKINEAENSVIPISGATAVSWIPNASAVGPDGLVYVIDDNADAKTYYTYNPNSNWAQTQHTITWDNPLFSGGRVYTYRMIYCSYDNHWYLGMGGTSAQGAISKYNPTTGKAESVHIWPAGAYTYGMAFDPKNPKMLYVAVSSATVGYGIWKMDVSNPSAGFTRLNSSGATASATVANLNDGPLVSAGFGQCWQLAFDNDGFLYASDANNHIIRKINLTSQTVETFLGVAGTAGTADGKKDVARLNAPRGIVWNKDGTAMYISDFGSNRIRKWSFD